jgi:hypothetical protein
MCRLWRMASLAALLLAASCGGATTPGIPTALIFRADITDPIGDAVRNPAYPQFATPPDLMRATVDAFGGMLFDKRRSW